MVIRRRFGSVPPVMVSSGKRTRSFDPLIGGGRYAMDYPVSRAYDRRAEDLLGSRVSNASIISNYALEEGYDTARKSRNRDAQLLRDATDAIVFSESFATPQTSVAARRVARGQSMASRATSLPPRPLYPAEVDFLEVPKGRVPLYTTDTTTTEDDYFPFLPYRRPPVPLAYPNPWLRWSPVRAKSMPPAFYVPEERPRRLYPMPVYDYWRRPARATSVPPAFYVPEEPPRRLYPMPVYDYWRRPARATSVPVDVLPVRHPWHFPYLRPGLTTHYRRRLALSQLPRAFAAMPLPSEGLRAHRVPRPYLSRMEVAAGLPGRWPYYYEQLGAKPYQGEVEEEELRPRIRPRVLASPIARANFARAWRYALSPYAAPKSRLSYFLEPKHGFPLLYVSRKGEKKGGHPKAAIIANKLDVDTLKGRRPRSDYAARKYRAMNRAEKENIYMRPGQTTAYYASNPPLKRRW